MNSETSNSFAKEKDLLYDIGKKIDSQKQVLSQTEFQKLLSFSIEICTLISQKTKIPKEKEFYLSIEKLLREISKSYDGNLLQKYLRIILMNPSQNSMTAQVVQNRNEELLTMQKKGSYTPSYILYNQISVELWDENNPNLIKDLSFSPNFIDSNGFLKLSPSLETIFSSWKRPKDIYPPEKLTIRRNILKPNEIKQTQVGDCSLISSIIILLNYEQKFKYIVISKNVIFPDYVNPAGKYAVKMFFDGKWCKVVIDDFFPISKYNSLLCSHTVNEGELFVSLIEKAYLKYHYGYDFPGSTSSSDIWRLIKWIPEFIFIGDSDKKLLWKKMLAISRDGSGVMAAGTGSITDKLGLAEEHCYAILDTMDIDCGNGKILHLMIMQNPWRKSEIQERFSFKNYASLPARMKQILTEIKQGEDKGMFLIEFEKFCESFEDLHISWNPSKIFVPQSFNREISKVEKMPNILLITSLKKSPQYLIYNVQYDPNHPNQIMWLLINHHLEKPLEYSKKVVNLRIFLTTQGSVEKIDKSYFPDKTFPLELTKYYKKQFSLAKLYLKEIYDEYKIKNMKFIVIVTHSDSSENADFNSVISYSLYFYANFSYDLGEIQSSSKEHEFLETLEIETREGFTDFDNSNQFVIDFGDIGKSNDQSLKIEIENSSNNEIQAILVMNTLKRECINQRISEEMMNDLGLQLFPQNKNTINSSIVQEYEFKNIEKLNLIIFSANISSSINFSLKITSKNEMKCFKLKKLPELLPRSLKIKNALTPNNQARQIGPTYIFTVEKEQALLLKSTSKIRLSLYQFPYRQFRNDFSDLPYNSFNFSKPIMETYSHTNEIATLGRGTYFLRVENFLNNPIYQNLGAKIFEPLYMKNQKRVIKPSADSSPRQFSSILINERKFDSMNLKYHSFSLKNISKSRSEH